MRLINLYIIAISLGFIPSVVFAASATINFTVEENIVTPLTITKVSDMLFATTVVGGYSGDLSSTQTVNGSVGHDAQFNITGQPHDIYKVTSDSASMILYNGSNQISVSLGVCDTPDGAETAPPVVRSLDGSGNDTFYVQGVAHFSLISHPYGLYYGEKTVVVGYY